MPKTYQPSGKVGRLLPIALLVLLLPGIGAGVAMAAFTTYMPLGVGRIAIVWLVGPLLMSVLLGLCVNTALRAAHVRNESVGRGTAVFVGVLTAYVASAMVLWFVFREGGTSLPLWWVFRPDVLLVPSLTYDLAHEHEFPPAVLLLSAVLFAGVPYLTSRLATSAPYCEACGRWAGRFGAVAHLAAGSGPDLRDLVRSWDLQGLLGLRHATDADDLVDVVEAARCPGCRAFAVVRVKQIEYQHGKTHVVVSLDPLVAPGVEVDLLAGLVHEAERPS